LYLLVPEQDLVRAGINPGPSNHRDTQCHAADATSAHDLLPRVDALPICGSPRGRSADFRRAEPTEMRTASMKMRYVPIPKSAKDFL
jgi:hypothetical protein